LEQLESTSVDEVSGTSIQQQLHRSKQASAEVGLLLTSTPFVANDSEPALSEKNFVSSSVQTALENPKEIVESPTSKVGDIPWPEQAIVTGSSVAKTSLPEGAIGTVIRTERIEALKSSAPERLAELAKTAPLASDEQSAETVAFFPETQHRSANIYSPKPTEVLAEAQISSHEKTRLASTEILPSSITPPETGQCYDTRLDVGVLDYPSQSTRMLSAAVSDSTALPGDGQVTDAKKSTNARPKWGEGSWRTAGVGAGSIALALVAALAMIQRVGNQPTENVPVVEPASTNSDLPSATDSPTAQAGLGTAQEGGKQTGANVQQPEPNNVSKSSEPVGVKTIPPQPKDSKPIIKVPDAIKSSGTKQGITPTQKASSSEPRLTKDTDIEIAKTTVIKDPAEDRGTGTEKKLESPVKNPPPQIASLPPKPVEAPTPPAAEPRFSSLVVIAGKRELTVKDRVLLTVKGRSSDGTESELLSGVTWNTTDPSVARVNSRGELEALGQGRAQITARYSGGTNLVYSFQVTVVTAQQTEKPEEGIKGITRGTLR